jgi:formate hydrogenlyase subunit 3/multisubunit Na+/H+ antiporter MnhD subunit
VSHRRAHDREGVDLAFAAAILGMVLLSPITWPHGFLILLLPLVLLARRLDHQHIAASLAFVCCVFVLTARPTWWLFRFESSDAPFQHWVPPGGLWLVTTEAFQSYALVGIFVLVVISALSSTGSDSRSGSVGLRI